MKHTLILVVLTCLPGQAIYAVCKDLLNLELPDARIETAQMIAEPVPHCKTTGTIGRNIGFSLWLPEQWNGRFVMGGAGGFVRPEDNQALRLLGDSVLTRGYATASTDTGHRGDGQDASWALNDWEAIVNYGHLGMHRAVTNSKAAIAGHYGRRPEKSFFIGCSNGGRQALHEAQRYPEDFDGIIAGAPALNFTGVTAAFLQITQHMFPNQNDLSTATVTHQDRKLLREAIERQCDHLDGLRDRMLHDPTRCDFDPATLLCSADQTGQGCLSASKIAAIKNVYGGPTVNGRALHVGFPYGAESTEANGWGSWFTMGSGAGGPPAAYNFSVGLMRNFVYHNPDWTYAGYDWSKFSEDMVPVSHVLNATSPDLSAFRANGGKLLIYHGWADVALSAHMSTDYVEQVYQHDTSAVEDIRLFMVPGMLHCFGGPGPSQVDWLGEIEQWHNNGDAPETITARFAEQEGARKLCAWPATAVYQSGDANNPASYMCEGP